MKALGRQILAEYYDCDQAVLNSYKLIKKYMACAAPSIYFLISL